ncbi:hypothetical protein [Aeromonas caviae]|uniref:hypothetical protein n=1 Tax=Aeromonas caviae TaxID=648 RepID=UPI0038D1F285
MAENFLTKLGDCPRVAHSHVWADYVELLALTNEDGFFSCGALEDTLTEVEDIAVDQDGYGDDDAISRRWADIKGCFNSRATRLGDDWPFRIDDTIIYRNIDIANPSVNHKLYIGLLIASCLRYVQRGYYAPITSSLEYIGYFFFKKLMPEPWVVKAFAAHQNINGAYEGTLKQKFTQLARDINAKLMLEDDQLDPRDTGDGGIDLVAWHPFGDALGNIPVAFAQCGCSLQDLEHKQFEASPANLNSKIYPQHPGMNYYFAPHDIRKNNGKWDKTPGQVILLDRARIMKLAELYPLEEQVVNWPHIDALINLRLSIA